MSAMHSPAPIVVFVYNRPVHTAEMIESLAKNTMARQSDLLIFSDAEKGDADRQAVTRVRETVARVSERGDFRSVRIFGARQHRGLARSVISGVSQVLDEYDRVIVLEDDLVTSPDFLSFMNDALERYRLNLRVWSISGYSPPIALPADYAESVYFTYRGSSWGYGTWKNRWAGIDWSVSDYHSFRTNRGARSRLNRGGRDMAQMLDRQMEGAIDSWAIRWCYAQSKQDALTVYPVQSLVRNIGLDGSGTHSGFATHFSVNVGQRPAKEELCDPFLDKRALTSFRDRYGTAIDHLRISVSRLLRGFVDRGQRARSPEALDNRETTT